MKQSKGHSGRAASKGSKKTHTLNPRPTKPDDLESDPGDEDIYEVPMQQYVDFDDHDEQNEQEPVVQPDTGLSKQQEISADSLTSSAKLAKSAQELIYERFKRIYDPTKPKKKYFPKINKETASIMDLYRPRHIATSLLDHELDDIFEVQRQEHLAAKVIQKFFRKSRLFLPLRRATKMVSAIIPVQSLLRGVMTRKLVAKWHVARTRVVSHWQARIRRNQSNKHVRPKLAKEYKAACEIQRIIRGKIARARCWRIKSNIAAERIQCLWRGTVARVRADMMWLNRVVVPIQCYFRRKIAKRMLKDGLSEVNSAALKIQQCFRAWKAKERLGNFLHLRELDYRLNQVAALTSDEEYTIEQLGKLAQRISKGVIKKKLDEAAKALYNDFDEIYNLENDLIESRRQREILSPRAIQQGWVKELDQGVIDFREKLTNLKLNCLFNNSYKVALLEKEVERRVDEVVAVGDCRDKLRLFREQEYADRRDRYYERELRAHRKAQRIAIADEKRKWRLLFYTKDGKPDKKRRPGRQWDSSCYAKDDKMTYTGAGVDLMAFKKDRSTMKPGSDEAVSSALNNFALQTYLEQMNHYEQLMNPITEIMQKTLGAPPRAVVPPEELGFGPMGSELPTALADIGAIPQFWGHQSQPPPPSSSESFMTESIDLTSSVTFGEEEKTRRLGPIVDRKHIEKSLVLHKKSSMSGKTERHPHLSQKPISKEELPALKDINLKRRQRQRERRKSPAVIPWALLDELDGEKKRFENEKSFIEFTYKY